MRDLLREFRWWAQAPAKVGLTIDPAAITLGIYDIHYDTSQVNLKSPTWDNLATIAEELQHGVQFIQMWQNMPDTRSRWGG